MALVNWCSNWDLGNASIDAQHREMADILNKLEAAVAAGAANDSTRAILVKLFQFTEAHFAYEQDLFRQANYPAADLHTRHHGYLRLILKRVGETLDSNRKPVADRGHLEFLRGWLMDHINRDDRAFADHLREKEAMLPPAPASCV